MEVSHGHDGPRSPSPEMHVKRLKTHKNTVKMGALQWPTLLLKGTCVPERNFMPYQCDPVSVRGSEWCKFCSNCVACRYLRPGNLKHCADGAIGRDTLQTILSRCCGS